MTTSSSSAWRSGMSNRPAAESSAYVTNHGYLDNATFRLMRHELLRVFPRIEIVDLHGNRKKHEISPDGSRDENVFGLDQGIAIGLLCRPPTLARRASEGNTLIDHRSIPNYGVLANEKLEVHRRCNTRTKQHPLTLACASG